MIKEKKENRLHRLFHDRKGDSKVMSLFLTAGYPEPEATADLILGFEKNGAELIELGMPFSDPLADGPTIQYSSNKALENGITMNGIFEMVREARTQSDIPIILMGYVNPVMRYGVESFCEKASEAGVDGLIIPDIPVDESLPLQEQAAKHELAMVYLVAPNTSEERMRLIDQKSEGFVYCVSVTGVTGARDGEEVSQSVNRFIERVKKNVTRNPKMVGFGIRSHEDAMTIARDMEGFIVGSALIDVIRKHYPEKGWKDEVFAFVRSLKYGST